MKKTSQPKHNKIERLSFVNLYTSDVDKLITFYRHVMGLKPNKNNTKRWFGFHTGETTFAIEPKTNRKKYTFKFNKQNPILLQFKVKDVKTLEQLTKFIEKRGITIQQKMIKKRYGTITTFLDPDGNPVELLAER